MKKLIGAALVAAAFAFTGAVAVSPASAATSQQQPAAQPDRTDGLTDVSAQRRHRHNHHRHHHHRHRHYHHRPHFYAPQYYRPYAPRYYAPRYYRPHHYAPRYW